MALHLLVEMEVILHRAQHRNPSEILVLVEERHAVFGEAPVDGDSHGERIWM